MSFLHIANPASQHRKSILILTLSLSLASCANFPATPITVPMNIPKNADDGATTQEIGARAARTSLSSTTGLETPSGRSIAAPITSSSPPQLSGDNISINFEGVALPAFVNTVFGDLLNVTFEIESSVLGREQLVTLRTAETMPPDEFYALVVQVLSNYGVSVAYENNVYRVVESATAKRELPRIVRTRAFSNVPGDMRPVFFYAPIENVRVRQMQIWIGLTMPDRVQVVTVPFASAILLLGAPEDVAAALEVMEILDQPNLAGSRSLKISPAFWSASKLTQQLAQVLRAEGYAVEIGPDSDAGIKFVPVEALNTIIVFASSQRNLQHVLDWAVELDQPGQTINTTGVYYHQVQNTNAEEIAELIDELLQGGDLENSEPNSQAIENSNTNIVVDVARNAIIFQGSAEEYAQFRSLAEQMDRAPYEVLIEATVAEVTLDQGESLGVVLDFDDGASLASNSTAIESQDGISISLIRDQGDFTASLNAAADESNVTILSSPRLIAASGKSATMQVGTQVPIITTQQTAPDGSTGGTNNILQQVQYRNTGVVLSISPVVNSSRRVELTIGQEVSDAQSNDTSNIQSPIILTRSFNTTLSIDDGETVLLAGLISENRSSGENGIPYLKDVPLLGNLFKSQSRSVQKTELIVLLTPYIIDNRDSSRFVRDAFQAQLGGLAEYFPEPTPVAPGQ